ncbi:hypothetical protein [Subsaximicrobium wynnwilliamsii]|uniref:hypothetical protein n=1 Tax=Subsaximicrobium wynnwilliamsii TaxID=291179 RepID=UPI001671BBFD|nr:hypothetical protein [Subsaximicrobium wynnwilliamsii]
MPVFFHPTQPTKPKTQPITHPPPTTYNLAPHTYLPPTTYNPQPHSQSLNPNP